MNATSFFPRAPRKSRGLKRVLAACEESRQRMNRATPAERAALEREARRIIAEGPKGFTVDQLLQAGIVYDRGQLSDEQRLELDRRVRARQLTVRTDADGVVVYKVKAR